MASLNKVAKDAGDKQKRKKQTGKLKAFFKGVWAELKKVHWPSRKQLITYTGVVIMTVLVMALAISLVDWIVSTLLELALGITA
jgi:preprotein translocase subunit SecE